MDFLNWLAGNWELVVAAVGAAGSVLLKFSRHGDEIESLKQAQAKLEVDLKDKINSLENDLCEKLGDLKENIKTLQGDVKLLLQK